MTWWRVYPLLAAIYPVLHLAASNAGEWIQFSDLLTPLALSAAATVTAWIVAALVTRDPDKRSFLAFLGVLAFIGGRPAVWFLTFHLPSVGLNPTYATLLLLAGLGVCVTIGTVHSRRSFTPVSRFLAPMMTLLVVFPLAQFAMAERVGPAVGHAPVAAPLPASVPRAGHLPTIYLIVLDKYQGASTLRSYYGFENAPFERALRERGFAVPRRPRANYTHTRQALSALLNWAYLDSLVRMMGEDETDLTPIYRIVENNRAMAFLKELGYEIVFFPNSYEPFRRNRHADLQLPDPDAIRPEFETVWIESTIIVPLARVICKVAACVYVPGVAESATLTDWKFAQLGRLAASSRPQFVLAHLLVPHEPYVYQSDCGHVPPSLIWSDSAATRAAYLDQITCVNAKVLTAVDAILRNAPTPPVILLQSDHGNGHVPRDDLELADASLAMVRSRVDIFAAYYVPGASDTLFYEGMTPVNVLPRVFNHVFGTTFPRLPDRSYWVVDKQPYRLTPLEADELAPTDADHVVEPGPAQ